LLKRHIKRENTTFQQVITFSFLGSSAYAFCPILSFRLKNGRKAVSKSSLCVVNEHQWFCQSGLIFLLQKTNLIGCSLFIY